MNGTDSATQEGLPTTNIATMTSSGIGNDREEEKTSLRAPKLPQAPTMGLRPLEMPLGQEEENGSSQLQFSSETVAEAESKTSEGRLNNEIGHHLRASARITDSSPPKKKQKQEKGPDSEDAPHHNYSSDFSSDEESSQVPAASASAPPPFPPGVDNESIELEIEDTSDDEVLFRQIVAAAAARGIPLDFLAGHRYHDDDDDEDIEYPFDPPTSLADVANFMKSEQCRKILILSGAGMSVASGIPDFRSRDGFYATLNADLLSCTSTEQVEQIRSDPCYCLDQHLFLENPLPCLEVNREFILGTQARKWKPTLAHRILTMTTAGKLCRWYTQNIDGLEDACCDTESNINTNTKSNISANCNGKETSPSPAPPSPLRLDQVIAVHGSMDRAACAVCHTEMKFDLFCQRVRTQIKDISGQDPIAPKISTPIVCDACGAPSVKPNIVLFRSSLPQEFFQNISGDVQNVDLLLIIGTSLHVAPANSLVWRVPKKCMRVLINREPVGWHLGMNLDQGSSKRDYFARGSCEATALDLLEHLGRLRDIEPFLDGLPEASAKLAKERMAATATAEKTKLEEKQKT